MDQDINFTLNFVDNITATVNRVESSVGKLDTKITALNTNTQAQNVSFLAQVQAVRSVDMGFRGLVNVGTELGILTGGLAKGMRTLSTAVHGVSSAYQLLKGARQILLMLRSAEVGVATVEAFRAGLKGKMGLVILGLGVAAGVGGYLAGRASVDNSTSVTQNITFNPYQDQTDQMNATSDMLNAMGGY